ncbi:DUF663-domain-containing protein [Rhizoclosmatium globosum]|uniref:DUF663-domain-containing protein n=1 Tax=Rhizoclosmatium globosum TaxID=329046 RepID=A0A1Y2CYK1_9FUNG|nr:DUF663-domain-containing protein [Rhizoclosmatium globosum]|eukprot:ORY52109.1 DUF663-domain-containing protein [Rhizoclosmatium globosum]
MSGQAHHHRSSAKSGNKGFKSKHATKGSIKAQNKGKVNRNKASSASTQAQKRADRRNASKIEQQKKRADLMMATRLFSGPNAPPKVIAIVPLCPDVDAFQVIRDLFESLDMEVPDNYNTGAPVLMSLANFKQRLLLIPTPRTVPAIIPHIQTADFMLPVMSATIEVDSVGDLAMSAIKSIGVPTILGGVVQNLQNGPDPKTRDAIRKSLQSFLVAHFPSCDGRIYSLRDVEGLGIKDGMPSAHTEAAAFARHVSGQIPKGSVWRDRHSYVLSEGVDFVQTGEEEGVLKVTGFVRGTKFDANRLVYIPGFGEFQVQKITTVPIERKDEIIEPAVLQVPNPELQDSLVAFNTPDPLDAEQTWPTEEELADAEARVAALQRRREELGDDFDENMDYDGDESAATGEGKKKTKKVPKGTSSYQAAWIVDSEDENDEDDDDDDEDDDEDDEMKDGNDDEKEDEPEDNENEEDEEYEEVELEDKQNDFDVDFNAADDARQYKSYLESKKLDAADEDLKFPDEMDTPRDIAARLRFSKYRGLKSFRTSPWDPYENLPIDYAKIFQFESFKKTKTRIIKDLEENDEGVDVGRKVIVWIEGVPKKVLETISPSKPFVVFTLLPHENKITLSTLSVHRVDEPGVNSPVIKSKEPLILFVGFRRYVIQPIYSADSRSGSNNVHRFERYFHHGRNVIASFYGPIGFESEPVLLFKENEKGGAPTLVATGNLVPPTPQRIIAKRIMLTGHPFKIHKRSAVIRYMFFNPQDIEYFKPVQLTTKLGRIGHIKESLGTHGYMKCMFDEQLTASDTVCLSLYKRVFPKWNTRNWVEEFEVKQSNEMTD